MKNELVRRLPLLLATSLVAWLVAPWASAADGAALGAAGLQDKFKAISPQLEGNAFHRRLTLESNEAAGQLGGDIYAVIDHPFSEVSGSLGKPQSWCEVLMLHLNTKHCAVRTSGANTSLAVAVGRKFDQPLADAQRIEFKWRQPTVAGDYLGAKLSADAGPLSTRDYRIELEATPLEGGKSFIHLSYAYAYGAAARLAMQGYLATIGSDKVGFTPAGKNAKDSADATSYIGGVRGVVERNTMRYYLAIDAYLDAPRDAQLDQRLAAWFDATERYARQLHEVDRADYLAMKRNEFNRMKSTP